MESFALHKIVQVIAMVLLASPYYKILVIDGARAPLSETEKPKVSDSMSSDQESQQKVSIDHQATRL